MRDKVASGVAWSIAEKVGSMLLQMGVSIVILRLLTPEQMGIMAIPVVFSSLALVMVDSGFSQTLIRKAVPSEEDYKSVFVFNIAVSVLLYLLLVGAMPWIARFYGMPELVRIASGVVPACASQCPVRDSEYDFTGSSVSPGFRTVVFISVRS